MTSVLMMKNDDDVCSHTDDDIMGITSGAAGLALAVQYSAKNRKGKRKWKKKRRKGKRKKEGERSKSHQEIDLWLCVYL